jgi:hypothetical protein
MIAHVGHIDGYTASDKVLFTRSAGDWLGRAPELIEIDRSARRRHLGELVGLDRFDLI